VRAFFETNLALAQPLPPFNFSSKNAPSTRRPLSAGVETQQVPIDHVVIGDGSILTDLICCITACSASVRMWAKARRSRTPS